MGFKPVQAPKCPRCTKSVFHAELVVGAGKEWHKACFRCAGCKKSLDSTNVTEKDNEIFCKSCYGRSFGPKGYGYGGGAGTLSMDSKKSASHTSVGSAAPATESFSQASLSKTPAEVATKNDTEVKDLSKYVNTDMCPRCDKRVYFAEKMIAANCSFHKACLRCVMPKCGKSLDSTNLSERQGQIYCKSCYGANFGAKGYGYGGGAGALTLTQ